MILAWMLGALRAHPPVAKATMRVDAAYIAALDARERLSPQEAVIRLGWLLSGPDVPWGTPSDAVRRTIEETVNRVEWPPLGRLPQFSVFVQRAAPSMDAADHAVKLVAGLALVTSAWDLDLRRRQFLPWVSGVVCIDPAATLRRGIRKVDGQSSGVDTYLSDDWPWRREGDRFRLGLVELPPVPGGMVGGGLSWYVRRWRDQDRASTK